MENRNLPEEIKGLMEHHGHLCFGVLLGYRACKYAVDIIGMSENMKVITEKGGCGNDAVSYLLDCTTENGRLVVREGKGQSWSFFNYDEDEGISLKINPVIVSQLPKDKEQAEKYIMELPGNLLFMAEPFFPA